MKRLKVKEKCDRCDGRGFRIYSEVDSEIILCKQCRGHQEIDWVEKVVGVKKPMIIPKTLILYHDRNFFNVRIEEPHDYIDRRFK
jgi:hypothetical protein